MVFNYILINGYVCMLVLGDTVECRLGRPTFFVCAFVCIVQYVHYYMQLKM